MAFSNSFSLTSSTLLPCLILLVLFVRPSHAFGAGNIAGTAKIEGTNWRHGDIEDTLLQLLISAASSKKFSKMDVKRVYFGNWLRDYSQAVDVGTVKMVSAEAIRILLWILGFLSFGYGTAEFEVTRDRLGCYRPEEHIDNPKDYADNLDARQYDRRLRGPVDERRELAIDERTGLKTYIASEDKGITTSAGLVRDLFGRCIQLGRQYNRNGNKADFYEALRLLGTGCHCLEDYSAHSNFTELALIELGEEQVFPHVGRRTQVQVRGARRPIYPIVTGTFGGVDFLHSVCGEFSDKATQSEVQELEGTIENAQNNQESASALKDILSKLPSGLLGGDKSGKADELQANSQAAQMQQMHITPKEPEAFTQQINEIQKQIYPILQFHDEIMQQINETIEQIPVLPDLIEQVQDQINIFVFSLLAPFVLPIIKQVKSELSTGSSEIIQSSEDKQHIVFHDDQSSDPTHSMLSKDHFSNILNEPAGKVASQVLKWAVPQIVECWDDESIDPNRAINRIIHGVFHHPALRDQGEDGARDGRQAMFRVVEGWWRDKSEREKDDLRDKLSREGVEQGRNHKEGVHDSGHGCGKPLGMAKVGPASGGGPAGQILGGINQALGGGGSGHGSRPSSSQNKIGSMASEAVGGGALGGLVGGLVGGIGGSLLGGGKKSDDDEQTSSYQSSGYNQGGSYTQSYGETTSRPGGYGQSEYGQTQYPSGGRKDEYKKHEQHETRYGGVESRVESSTYSSSGYGGTSSYGGGTSSYGQTEEHGYGSHGPGSHGPGSHGPGSHGPGSHGPGSHGPGSHGRTEEHRYGEKDSDDDDSGDDEAKREKKERKRREKEEKQHHKKYDDDSDDDKPKRHSGGYGQQRRDDDYGGGRQEYGGGRQEYGGGRQDYGGGRQDHGGGRQEYGGGRQEYGGRRQEHGSGGYGEQRQEYGGGGYGQDRPSYGGGGYGQERPQHQGGGGFGGGGMPGGFGEERPSYGGGGGAFGEDRPSYGGGGGYGESQGGGFGGGGGYEQRGGDSGFGRSGGEEMPGGFGGNEFGERRGGYGQGGNESGGYGGGGYGGRY